MLDLEPIKSRLAAATPGPWGSCDDSKCKCRAVLCNDHPVAEVVKGDWGDDYPSLRIVGPSLDQKVEAYMEQITYGHIPEDQFLANRAFIRESWSDIKALVEEIERLRSTLKHCTIRA